MGRLIKMLDIILIIIGILMVIDSLFVLLYPKLVIKLCKGLFKSIKTIKKIGVIEFIVGIILILIGSNI